MSKHTTKRCARCGISKSTANFNKRRSAHDGLQAYCRECQKAKATAYYAADPEGQRQRVADYRSANPEKVRASTYRRYWADPEAARARAIEQHRRTDPEVKRRWGRDNYARHRAKLIAKAAKYAALNPARVRRYKDKWQQANPLKRREMKHRRRAREYATQIAPINLEAIYHRDHGICHICHNPVPAARLHYDHVIPLARGGTHTEDNIKVSHARCNLKKGANI